jgi:hypothetical protein
VTSWRTLCFIYLYRESKYGQKDDICVQNNGGSLQRVLWTLICVSRSVWREMLSFIFRHGFKIIYLHIIYFTRTHIVVTNSCEKYSVIETDGNTYYSCGVWLKNTFVAQNLRQRATYFLWLFKRPVYGSDKIKFTR